MSKYWLFFKNSFSESLMYRSHIFMLASSQTISFCVFIFLWKAIYDQGSRIGQYSLNDLIVYYIFSTLLSFTILGVDVAWRVGDEIRLGSITNFILKPIKHFWSIFGLVAGKTFLNLFLILIVATPFIFVYRNFILENFNLIRFFGFAVAFIFSLFIFIEFFYLVGISTFWLGDAKGFNFLIRMIMFFLAGNILPLDLLPKILLNLNNFLPFRFMNYFPIAIITGKVSLNFSILAFISFLLRGEFLYPSHVHTFLNNSCLCGEYLKYT